MRAATEVEILATARDLLVEGGTAAVTLREVGRRMGMTASALYRYYDGMAALRDALVASFFDELVPLIAEAGETSEVASGSRTEHTLVVLMRASRAFRDWGLGHRAEFGLMFGPREPGWDAGGCVLEAAAGRRFGQVFAGMFAAGFSVDPDGDGPTLVDALPHPLGELFARAWVRLLGTVSAEVYDQMSHVHDAPGRLFELEMVDCGLLIAAALADAGAGPVPDAAAVEAMLVRAHT